MSLPPKYNPGGVSYAQTQKPPPPYSNPATSPQVNAVPPQTYAPPTLNAVPPQTYAPPTLNALPPQTYVAPTLAPLPAYSPLAPPAYIKPSSPQPMQTPLQSSQDNARQTQVSGYGTPGPPQAMTSSYAMAPPPNANTSPPAILPGGGVTAVPVGSLGTSTNPVVADQVQRSQPGGRGQWSGQLGKQKRKRVPELCCCDLQSGVTLMASVDIGLAISLAIYFLVQSFEKDGELNVYPFIGTWLALLFIILGVILLISATRRSKPLSWTFIIGNFILYIGSVVPYFILYWPKILDNSSKWMMPLLFFGVTLYKIYESTCAYYCPYDEPDPLVFVEPRYISNMAGSNVVPVVYSPTGQRVYYVNHPSPYYYGHYNDPSYAMAGAGLGLASGMMLSHALWC